MTNTVWRGRKVYYSKGEKYPRVFWPEHPLAHKSGLVRIHRIVASEKIGRVLSRDEHVHHANENSLDWTEANLVIKTPQQHMADHQRQERVIRQCAFCSAEIEVLPRRAKQYAVFYCGGICQRRGTTKAVWPSDEELREMVKTVSLTRIAKLLGVSDNAVRKRCKIRRLF